MANRKTKNVPWTVEVDPLTSPALSVLAIRLSFFKEGPGDSERKPSPSAMLDALAEAFYRDPTGVMYALRVIGVNPEKVAFISFTQDEVHRPEDR